MKFTEIGALASLTSFHSSKQPLSFLGKDTRASVCLYASRHAVRINNPSKLGTVVVAARTMDPKVGRIEFAEENNQAKGVT